MAKKVLTVIMEDRLRTEISIIHENQCVPYDRRTVHIPLTDEQIAMIEPRFLGHSGGQKRYEDIGSVWLEDIENE